MCVVFSQQKNGALVVARLHALLRQRSGVLDLLLADAAEAHVDRVVVGVGRPAMHHAARTEFLVEFREVLRIRPVGQLGFFFRVQVIEIAKKLIEAVGRRQKLVAVSEVVLAELSGRVAMILQQLRDRGIFGLKAGRRSGHADFREPGAEARLSGDERRAARGATLLAVRVGEAHSFVRQAVDIRRAIAHEAIAVAAQVRDADVVTPDDENVRLCRAGISGGAACAGGARGRSHGRILSWSDVRERRAYAHERMRMTGARRAVAGKAARRPHRHGGPTTGAARQAAE
jgi:hypothetical protein